MLDLARRPRAAGRLALADGAAVRATTRHARRRPRPAATIVLVRPGPDGLEVLLTRRPDSMAFAAGLHVFPGGRVEAADADPRLVARARGPRDGAGFRVAHRIAAIRETWEEVGVLLADARRPGIERRLPARRVPTGERPSTISSTRLDLDAADRRPRRDRPLDDPAVMPRRFDARFFVAELPPGAVLARIRARSRTTPG